MINTDTEHDFLGNRLTRKIKIRNVRKRNLDYTWHGIKLLYNDWTGLNKTFRKSWLLISISIIIASFYTFKIHFLFPPDLITTAECGTLLYFCISGVEWSYKPCLAYSVFQYFKNAHLLTFIILKLGCISSKDSMS